MKSKLLSLFLALAASVGITFASVTIDGIAYNLNETDLTAEVTSGGSYSGNVVIPSQITYDAKTYRVTSIGVLAFFMCSSLTSVTIGNSVTSIGQYAFRDCSGLTSVVWNAKNCSNSGGFDSQVESFVFGNEVETIPASCCSGMNKLSSIEIPNSVTSIGSSAFSGCSGLTSVTIPNSVTSIGGSAFANCSSLTSINVADDNPNYSSKDGVLFDKQQTALIQCPGGKQGAYVIPNSVTSIGGSAFSGCSSLTTVTIGNSVTSIGDGAFNGCSSLTSVTLNSNAIVSRKYGNEIIYYGSNIGSIFGSQVKEYIIGESVTSIGNYAFFDCSGLTSVIFGTSVKVIEEYAFGGDCKAIKTITCYSMRPPTVNNGAFKSLDYSTIIYVPANYLSTYKMHDFWGIYDVRPIGAATTETTSVQVTPSETTATVAWPTVNGAETYEMVIKDKQGNVICTLIFNSNGQLTEIAFNAPSRYGEVEQTQTAGFSFTVTGLEEGTAYELTITSKDSNGATLDKKTVSFTTTGETGVDALQAGELHSSKVLRNGEVLILRDGKTYTIQGVEVK